MDTKNPSPPAPATPPADPENPSRLPIDPKTGLIDWGEVRRRGPRRVPEEWLRSDPTDEEWWATYGRGTFKNTAEYIEAGKRLDYNNAVRDGVIKAQYDEKGALQVPWKQKQKPETQPKSETGAPEGPQEARARDSLVRAFPPDGKISKSMSVGEARIKALLYLKPDPEKGPPKKDSYRRAIKKLGRCE